jgi:hypothetical protein
MKSAIKINILHLTVFCKCIWLFNMTHFINTARHISIFVPLVNISDQSHVIFSEVSFTDIIFVIIYFDFRLSAHCRVWSYPQTCRTWTSYHDCPYGNDINTISSHKRNYRTRLPTARMYTRVMHSYTFMLETRTKAVLFKAWHGFAFHAFPYSEKVTL